MPEKPIKAMESNPAVISAIGAPWSDFGIGLTASLSRMLENKTIARVRPMALAKL